jgi:hypothetical protein
VVLLVLACVRKGKALPEMAAVTDGKETNTRYWQNVLKRINSLREKPSHFGQAVKWKSRQAYNSCHHSFMCFKKPADEFSNSGTLQPPCVPH